MPGFGDPFLYLRRQATRRGGGTVVAVGTPTPSPTPTPTPEPAGPLYPAKLYARYAASGAGSVTQINDTGTGALHMTQGTAANQPTAQTSPAGKAHIRFDGAAAPNNDYLVLPAGFSLNSRNFAIFVARKGLPNNVNSQAFVHMPAGASTLATYCLNGSAAPGVFRIFDGAQRSSTSTGSHSPEVVCFWGDGAGSGTIHGREASPLPLLTNVTPSGGWFGAWNNAGNPTLFMLTSDLFEVRVYTGLTSAERLDVFDQLASEHNGLNRTADLFSVFEGDSTTFWGAANSATSPDDNWPEQAYQQQGTLKGRMKYINSGSGGMRMGPSGTASTMLATNMPEFLGALFSQNINYPKHHAFLLAGINDIHNGTSLASMESMYQEWITRLRTGAGAQGTGIKVGIGTIAPNEFSNQSVMTATNASIRANYATWGYQYLADFAADARLADTNNLTNYTADGTHMTRAGEAIKADIWHAAALAAGAI